jgi:hypothetical protein
MTKHKIDITRPQDYMFRDYPEIEIKGIIVNKEKHEDSICRLTVNFINKDGTNGNHSVGIHGNYLHGIEADLDLILRPKLQETKKRKVVSFSTCIYEDSVEGYAVTDDGLIFSIDMLGTERGWKKSSMPEVPQD